ncbi:MAG: formimidoylglutamase [Bacteroidales bacterium]|nr:formimidoylglutamase [Bacteroidales bacterium]MBR6162112.1 formimidoylglutamase [Bacteroidales bacterium]
MDLSLYFKAVDATLGGVERDIVSDQQLLSRVLFYNPEEPINIQEAQLAIIGVPEARNSYRNESCAMAPDEIRRQFYQLYRWKSDVRIVDLGNLVVGETVEDTYAVLADIIAYLLENSVLPIVLGGSNDLAFANYRAYEKIEKVVNLVSVDSTFDLGNETQPIRSDAYLNKMILQQPNYLLNYANIGYQVYMNSPADLKMMDDLFFETYRVGTMRKDLEEVEPIVRNADMVTIDISAVRRPDAPGCPHNSANGFYGEEICQIAKYAGVSDKLTSFGIYEYDPTMDYGNQTSQLISHILWYFVEGFLNRQQDDRFRDKEAYRQYSIAVSGALDEMVFYCSRKTGRWWVLVPIISKDKNVTRNYYLPCSKRDYDLACEDRISDRWWRAYHKLNH